MSNALVKQVPSFKISDGRMLESKLVALTEERKIAIRGVFNRGYEKKFGAPKNGVFTSAEIVDIIAENADEIAKTVKRFNSAIAKERVSGAKQEKS